MKNENPKVAIVFDGLFTRGGGERVLLTASRAFPNSTIYTTIYNAEDTFPEFKKSKIKTTWLNKFFNSEKKFKYTFLPLGILASRSINLKDYDVILAITTNCAKYVKTNKNALVINYCFTPFRLAWNPSSYTLYSQSKLFKRFILNFVIFVLKKIDYHYSKRANQYIAMTKETSQRIQDSYNFQKEIVIIRPTIDTTKFKISNGTKNYYLLVARLEKYKKVDLVIRAFNKLNLKLIIVGTGVEKRNLHKIANKNIKFLEGINDVELANLYSNAKAFIFPQHEDYGLTPLEANASGTPVIAYNKGGILETSIPYNGKNSQRFTSILFENQTTDSLIGAIKTFESIKYSPEFIRKHSLQFDDSVFIKNIRRYVVDNYKRNKIL